MYNLREINAACKEACTYVYHFEGDITFEDIQRFLSMRRMRNASRDFLHNAGMPVFCGDSGGILVGNDSSARMINKITGIKPGFKKIPLAL